MYTCVGDCGSVYIISNLVSLVGSLHCFCVIVVCIFVHVRWMHTFLSLPGPPNFVVSWQYLHVLQFAAVQPAHSPHLAHLWPIGKLTMESFCIQ